MWIEIKGSFLFFHMTWFCLPDSFEKGRVWLDSIIYFCSFGIDMNKWFSCYRPVGWPTCDFFKGTCISESVYNGASLKQTHFVADTSIFLSYKDWKSYMCMNLKTPICKNSIYNGS